MKCHVERGHGNLAPCGSTLWVRVFCVSLLMLVYSMKESEGMSGFQKPAGCWILQSFMFGYVSKSADCSRAHVALYVFECGMHVSVCVLHVHAISVDVFQKMMLNKRKQLHQWCCQMSVWHVKCSICSQVKQCMSILNDVCSSFVLHLEWGGWVGNVLW